MEKEKRKKEILKFEIESGITLPNVYIDFLTQYEGYSDGALIVYNISKIEERNNYMYIKETHPNYVAIGDDGGGLVFLMRQDKNVKEIIIIERSQTDLKQPFQVVEDFVEWHKDNFFIQEENNEENNYLSEYVEIVLIKVPEEGLKGILKIKKCLELQYSAKEILTMAKELPVVLKSDLRRIKAQRMIASTNFEEVFQIKKSPNEIK